MRRPCLRRLLLTVRDDHNPMDMIRHHHKSVQFHTCDVVGDFSPACNYNSSIFVQLHFSIDHVPEKTFLFVGAHRDEICTGLSAVIIFQPDGTTVVSIWGESHLLRSVYSISLGSGKGDACVAWTCRMFEITSFDLNRFFLKSHRAISIGTRAPRKSPSAPHPSVLPRYQAWPAR